MNAIVSEIRSILSLFSLVDETDLAAETTNIVMKTKGSYRLGDFGFVPREKNQQI